MNIGYRCPLWVDTALQGSSLCKLTEGAPSFWQVAQARYSLGKLAGAGSQSHLPLVGVSCAVKNLYNRTRLPCLLPLLEFARIHALTSLSFTVFSPPLILGYRNKGGLQVPPRQACLGRGVFAVCGSLSGLRL